MKIAILGGGVTGLTAGYFLAKKGYSVTIFEKEKILGGLASGFKEKDWDWYLDKTYHHLFANDDDILEFAHEIGFDKIFFQEPETASLYKSPISDPPAASLPDWQGRAGFQFPNKSQVSNNKFQTFPLDTPLDLLRFPFLNLPQRLRTGLIVAFLKFSPFFSFYEKQTAEEFLKRTMGKEAWKILWRQLFRKKFGNYAENILASFFWARIKKRTKSLGYIEEGFQQLVDYLEKNNLSLGVKIRLSAEVKRIEKREDIYNVYYNNQIEAGFDSVIVTLPTPTFTKIGEKILPKDYLSQLKKISYLHNITCVLETEEKLLDKTYWLNICDRELPFTVLVQHTNFIDKGHYDNNHILYIGNYVDNDNKLLKMTDKEIFNHFLPYLKKINPMFHVPRSKFYVFRNYFAQPIFNDSFLENKPKLQTPLKNLFIANMDMTYPYDRGTNYAVKLAKEITNKISVEIDF